MFIVKTARPVKVSGINYRKGKPLPGNKDYSALVTIGLVEEVTDKISPVPLGPITKIIVKKKAAAKKKAAKARKQRNGKKG